MERKIAGMSKKRSKKPDSIIREGDYVKIVLPYRFLRCGYALTLHDCHNRMANDPKYKKMLQDLVNVIIGYDENALLKRLKFDESRIIPARIRYKLEDVVAQMYMLDHNFGGPDRTLHTSFGRSLIGLRGKVVGIKFHKTGTYTPGWGYSDYYGGDYEYQPAFLDNEKTHKLLQLEIVEEDENNFKAKDMYDLEFHWYGEHMWIEDINVKKLKGEDYEYLCIRTGDGNTATNDALGDQK